MRNGFKHRTHGRIRMQDRPVGEACAVHVAPVVGPSQAGGCFRPDLDGVEHARLVSPLDKEPLLSGIQLNGLRKHLVAWSRRGRNDAAVTQATPFSAGRCRRYATICNIIPRSSAICMFLTAAQDPSSLRN